MTPPIWNRRRAPFAPLPLAVAMQWDVIDEAGHWYYEDEYQNFGLLKALEENAGDEN